MPPLVAALHLHLAREAVAPYTVAAAMEAGCEAAMSLEASWLSRIGCSSSGCFLQDSLNRYFRPRTVTDNTDDGHHHESDQNDADP